MSNILNLPKEITIKPKEKKRKDRKKKIDKIEKIEEKKDITRDSFILNFD